MTLMRVRLELARDHDFPEGSSNHGYEFTAPLDDEGRLRGEAWREQRDKCRVKRFWGDTEEETGHLVHKPGGAWAFHYDIHGDQDDDETGFKFQGHVFKPGEYVSVHEHDDEVRTFKVITVENVPGT